MREQKFYICRHCGNIVAMVKSSGVPVVCCGEPMQELVSGTVDAAVEKHVPDYKVEGNKVSVAVCRTSDACGTLYRMDLASDEARRPACKTCTGAEAGSLLHTL